MMCGSFHVHGMKRIAAEEHVYNIVFHHGDTFVLLLLPLLLLSRELRIFYSPQCAGLTPINQQMGVGFPHRAGRHLRGGPLFSSSGCWSCRYMKAFLTHGWDLYLPGCGGTSTLARGAQLSHRAGSEPQPISHQWMGVGFPHRAGRYRPRGSSHSSPG